MTGHVPHCIRRPRAPLSPVRDYDFPTMRRIVAEICATAVFGVVAVAAVLYVIIV